MKLQMYKHDYPGKLIVFCGLDGSGKTTQINLLKTYLDYRNKSYVCTKQPTNFVRASDIFRTYMDQEDHSAYDYLALSLLCASDRVQHSNHMIVSELKKGNIVLCDRYYYSCLANLVARGYKTQRWIYEIAQEIPEPDLSFFMDVTVDAAIARVRARPEDHDRYIDIELQHRLRKTFLDIADSNHGIIINTQNSVVDCFHIIKSAVDEVL